MIFSESTTIEFKREYTPELIKTIVAFANTNGGTVYIGITDDGRPINNKDIDETILKVGNAIRDGIKPDLTMFVEYQQEEFESKTVIKVNVQRGTSRPYYLVRKGIRPEGVYIRHGAATIPATETTILQMIKETDGEKYEDVRSIYQNLTFKQAEKEFEDYDVPFESNQKKTLGLINDDGMYTNLALLLSDQCLHTIKLAVYEGSVKAQFKDRREFDGSLLKQLNDAYEFIDRYNRNRSELNGLHRIDKRDYPKEAVREALLNALVHRDYTFRDSTLISIFDDRIEFVSIGGLVKGITLNDVALGVSVARNRKLANVFYRLTLIEAYGTGVPKIMRNYEGTSCKPKIEVTDNAFKIILPNINEKMKTAKSDETEEVIKDLLREKESISRKDVEKTLEISQAMAVRVLNRLIEKRLIRKVGMGKNTQYVLN